MLPVLNHIYTHWRYWDGSVPEKGLSLYYKYLIANLSEREVMMKLVGIHFGEAAM